MIEKNGKTDLLLKENFFAAQRYEQITLESESRVMVVFKNFRSCEIKKATAIPNIIKKTV